MKDIIDKIFDQVMDEVCDDPVRRFAELILEQERKEAAEHYLKLIRDCVATEREACAKVCDDLLANPHRGGGWSDATIECSVAIRARGDKHEQFI